MASFCGRNVLATWCQCLQDRDSSSCNPFCSSAVAVSAPWSNRHHNCRPNLPRMAATFFRCFGVLNFCVAWHKLFTKPSQAPRVVSSCQRMHMDLERPQTPKQGPMQGKDFALLCIAWLELRDLGTPSSEYWPGCNKKTPILIFCMIGGKFAAMWQLIQPWVSWYLATSVLSVSN